MEKLSNEAVLRIGRHLTAEELANCSAMSRGWRKAFNLDQLWEPLCDPTMVEHLRTTSPVVEPAFAPYSAEGSTLVPLCNWRLAFQKEKHLWNNWRQNRYRTETVPESQGELFREFLNDTLIIKWFPNRFQVAFSTIPAVLVTEYSFDQDFGGWFDYFVEKTLVPKKLLLAVRLLDRVKTFIVDVENKIIQPKREILLDDMKTEGVLPEYTKDLYEHKGKRQRSGLDCVKGNCFVHVNATRKKLDIFDLRTGAIMKVEACPPEAQKGTYILRVDSFPTSDYVLVTFRHKLQEYSYIYDPQKFSFIRGCLAQRRAYMHFKHSKEEYKSGEIYGDYFLSPHDTNVTVYSLQDFEMVLKSEAAFAIGFYKDKFLTIDQKRANTINVLGLSSKNIESLEGPTEGSYRVFNEKLLAYRDPFDCWCVLFGNKWVKCGVNFERSSAINAAFTKVISQDPQNRESDRPGEWSIHHYW